MIIPIKGEGKRARFYIDLYKDLYNKFPDIDFLFILKDCSVFNKYSLKKIYNLNTKFYINSKFNSVKINNIYPNICTSSISSFINDIHKEISRLYEYIYIFEPTSLITEAICKYLEYIKLLHGWDAVAIPTKGIDYVAYRNVDLEIKSLKDNVWLYDTINDNTIKEHAHIFPSKQYPLEDYGVLYIKGSVLVNLQIDGDKDTNFIKDYIKEIQKDGDYCLFFSGIAGFKEI